MLYGIDSRTKHSTLEIHTNDFDQDDEDEDEDLTKNTIWLVDQTYEITALVFNESGKQVYMAVEHGQSAIIYRIGVSENFIFNQKNVIFIFNRKIFVNKIV